MAGGKRTGPGDEGRSGIRKGFEGKAAGGKTMNSAVKMPAPKRSTYMRSDDEWKPSK